MSGQSVEWIPGYIVVVRRDQRDSEHKLEETAGVERSVECARLRDKVNRFQSFHIFGESDFGTLRQVKPKGISLLTPKRDLL